MQRQLDALAPGHHIEVAALRRTIEQTLREVIAAGVESGRFSTSRVLETALEILSLCMDMVRWFPARGLRTSRAVGDFYADLALRMVGGRL